MLVRLRPCYGKDCAEMLTIRGLWIVSTCPRVGKMSMPSGCAALQ